MIRNHRKNLGKILKEQRRSIPLTLQQLSDASGVSISHLGRIENGERFPSALILQRIADPLGYEEKELFTLAGYLSASTVRVSEKRVQYGGRNVDPDVIKVLGKEPVEVQRAVIGILNIFKNISASIARKQAAEE
jgi:transcriptional regulator with XRE-family HTH domain